MDGLGFGGGAGEINVAGDVDYARAVGLFISEGIGRVLR